MRDLKYYEQKVNNRFGTSAAPPIDPSMIPETATAQPLKWRQVPAADVTVLEDGSASATNIAAALRRGESLLMPIHPFEADRWPGETFIESGSVSVSASYRSMFFEAESGGILDGLADPGTTLMMKLHLERPLPGIAGDRRLSRHIVHKCVTLSPFLQEIMRTDPLGADCDIVPEFLGLANDETGVIFRQLPQSNVMPLFSLFSPDPGLPGAAAHIETALRGLYGDDTLSAANDLGEQLARPLLRPLFAGFRAGFSIEMHAQNVLFRPGDGSLIDRVYLRDLEGVVFSNRYRLAQGLEPLFADSGNPVLVNDTISMTRWFNRNVDHDLGRVFTASLDALQRSGYFGEQDRQRAAQSIRKASRRAVSEAALGHLDRAGRLLPVSRSPYGNGLSKGHYYRTRYR